MKAILIALRYLPYVLAGVQAVQSSLADHPGSTKKAAVLSAISAAAAVGDAVPEDHVNIISALIDSTVGTLNATGVFKSSKQGTLPLKP